MLGTANVLLAQTAPFKILLEPLNISGLSGAQAYAFGHHNGRWLIIGGRLDGLHRRQPFAAFNVAGQNNQLMVVNPITKQIWTATLTSLSSGLQEQLSSTNMEFFQEGDYLYLIGGYGYSNTAGDHITHPKLTSVKVSDVINAIIKGNSYSNYFRQIKDEQFAVTGGYLNKIYNTFYLTGGQRFDGRYNPMGPNHGPGFSQVYTNAIRRFKVNDDGINLSVTHLPSIIDAANLHRRDYNVVPQIMPTGQEGLTAFSGVFQVDTDLPFLNSVNIDSTGYHVNNVFTQYYNHYHCAHIPLYSAAKNEMHNVFFGGIAQFYDKAGSLVRDDKVPFVKTIARVTRDSVGTMTEYKLPVEMPALLGAGSEFIPLESLPQYNNQVLKLDDFTADTTLVGYIYGGISSSAATIFEINNGTQSGANSQIFKVFVIKNNLGVDQSPDPQSTGTLQMQVFPNPNDGNFILKFNLKIVVEVRLSIYDAGGKLLESVELKNLKTGSNTQNRRIKNYAASGVYFMTLSTAYEKATQKIIVVP